MFHITLGLFAANFPVFGGLVHAFALVLLVFWWGPVLWKRSQKKDKAFVLTYILCFSLLYSISAILHGYPWSENYREFLLRIDLIMICIAVSLSASLPIIVLHQSKTLIGVWIICILSVVVAGGIIFLPPIAKYIFFVSVGWIEGILLIHTIRKAQLPVIVYLVLITTGLAYTIGGLLTLLNFPPFLLHYLSRQDIFHFFTIIGGGTFIFFLCKWVLPFSNNVQITRRHLP
jgi:channel protein (hemolysin III family)